MKLYNKIKRLKRGITVQISLTFRCNYRCSYCSQKFNGGNIEKKETNFLGWVRWFKRFPYKIREVYVSGGEPTMHPDFVRITTWLLNQGYCVKVFSNLSNPWGLLQLPTSKRLIIKATYHHHIPESVFKYYYDAISHKHRVEVDEIGNEKILPFTKLHPMQTRTSNDYYDVTMLRISPDLTINLNCYELCTYK